MTDKPAVSLWRGVYGVLSGWLATGMLVVVTDFILGRAFPEAFAPGRIAPAKFSALVLATTTLYSVAGGWATAYLTAAAGWRYLIALAIWGELAGIASVSMTWGQTKWWYAIGLLVLWIPAVLLGGYLRLGGKTSA